MSYTESKLDQFKETSDEGAMFKKIGKLIKRDWVKPQGIPTGFASQMIEREFLARCNLCRILVKLLKVDNKKLSPGQLELKEKIINLMKITVSNLQ